MTPVVIKAPFTGDPQRYAGMSVMRQTAWNAGALALVALLPRPVSACSCALPILDPLEALRSASLVVAARVASIETVEVSGEATTCTGGSCETGPVSVRSPRLRLQVLREWKGSLRAEYLVLAEYVWDPQGKTGTPMLDCVLQVHVGEEYLIFASPNTYVRVGEQEAPLQVDSCSPVGLLRDSKGLVRRLNRARSAGR
jgi:hypothetical protein